MAGGAPEISLGQKYLTTADPFDPNYNTPDLHRDLKKLTCPSSYSYFNENNEGISIKYSIIPNNNGHWAMVGGFCLHIK